MGRFLDLDDLVSDHPEAKEELRNLRSELDKAQAKLSDHDSAAQAHKERAEYLAADLEQIRKDLKGHKDSLLSGENGLAQATMRGFEIGIKQLNVVVRKLEHARIELEKRAITIDVANDAILAERTRADELEKALKECRFDFQSTTHENVSSVEEYIAKAKDGK
jgi:chromosome segregation ATPase